jgi:D-alanyl-lipoteichoic acid acyltransferase DltB (MBOAT superfamily)
VNAPKLVVPVGISFYTFEAVSLLCDIRMRKIKEKVSLSDVYLYLLFFPTVTSGPIFRFRDFRDGMNGKLNLSGYGSAIDRIIIGLSKKVLVADKIAVLADYYFDGVASGNNYSCPGLWIGSITYTLQLYFDFSGYSDMAIGIGKLLGFDICENFNNPYQANSISDFWKRWHISLSQWFRDYVYIPLGGSRCSKSRHILNLFIVWVLTGIWHGADWSFVVWGLGYFVLLALEKYVPAMKKIGNYWYGHIYALFFINLLWVPFRADNLSVTLRYVSGMFGANGALALEGKAIAFLPFLAVAVCLCFPWKKWLERYEQNKPYKILKGSAMIVLTAMAVCAVINSSYAPYIYGNF